MIQLAAEWPRVTALVILVAGVLLTAGAFAVGSLTRSTVPDLRPQLAANHVALTRSTGQLAGAKAALRAAGVREAAQAATIANLRTRLHARPHSHGR